MDNPPGGKFSGCVFVVSFSFSFIPFAVDYDAAAAGGRLAGEPVL